MNNTNKRQGPATVEELQRLHRLMAAALIERLKAPQPSGEHLAVARSVVKDNGQGARSETDRAALRKLYGLLIKAFTEAIQREPSAAVMAEVRHFLHQQGVTKDLGDAVDKAQALRVLGSDALPFTTNTKH